MTVTAENIRDDVRANLGNRNDIDEATYYRCIHYAQNRIARLKSFNELETEDTIITTQGFRTYTFPSAIDARRIRKINSILPLDFLEQKYKDPLTRVPTSKEWAKLLTGQEVVAEQDTPNRYLWRIVNQISVDPIPDATYHLEISLTYYPVEVTEIIKGLELSLHNSDDIVTALATSTLLLRRGREDSATIWYQVYKDAVEEFVMTEADHSDLDMKAISNELSTTVPSTYWADPFSNARFKEQV